MNWIEGANGRYWEIFGEEFDVDCSVTIEPRPHYCDRGDWIAKLHPGVKLAPEIDSADAWPRYYFDLGVAKSEVVAWLRKRGRARISPANTRGS